jgi:hypothetical protein
MNSADFETSGSGRQSLVPKNPVDHFILRASTTAGGSVRELVPNLLMRRDDPTIQFALPNRGIGLNTGSDWQVWLTIPYWLLVVVTAVVPLVAGLRHIRNRVRVRRGCCPACGYDLRATPERCPECGAMPKSQREPPHTSQCSGPEPRV